MYVCMRSGHTHTAHQLTLGEGRSLGSTAELVGIVTTTLSVYSDPLRASLCYCRPAADDGSLFNVY